MSNTIEQVGSWERVAQELRACKEAQQRAYGNVDSATLGRYLAGEMSPDEVASLEQTLADLPELRKLTDLVQDVLGDLEPLDETAPVLAPQPLRLLPMTPVRPLRTHHRAKRFAALAVAACLMLAATFLWPTSGPGSRRGPISLVGTPMATRGVVTDSPVEMRMVWLESPPQLARDERPEANPQEKAAFFKLKDTVADKKDVVPTSLAVPENSNTTLLSLNRLNVAVTNSHACGDAEKAENLLRQHHVAYAKQLGDQHKATKWTTRQLAGLYQFALTKSVVEAKPLSLGGPNCPQNRAQQTALALRERVLARPSNQVGFVLTEALGCSECPNERLALIRALGELGPAAQPAVGVLCERLKRSEDPGERLAVLTVLDQMGSAASAATTTISTLLQRDQRKADVQPKKGETSRTVATMTEPELKLAQKVLGQLNGSEARVGVIDKVGLFSAKRTIADTRTLQELASQAKIEVRIESSDKTQPSMLPRMAPVALHVIFVPKKPVLVYASPALHRSGVDVKQLQKQLAECNQLGDHDRALVVLLNAVKKAQR